MFQNDIQRGRVCQRFCARLPGGADAWFRTNGEDPAPWPTEAATSQARRDALSDGERIMLRIALDCWNGTGRMRLDEALITLDDKNLRLLGAFLVAFSIDPYAIDGWLGLPTSCPEEDQ